MRRIRSASMGLQMVGMMVPPGKQPLLMVRRTDTLNVGNGSCVAPAVRSRLSGQAPGPGKAGLGQDAPGADMRKLLESGRSPKADKPPAQS